MYIVLLSVKFYPVLWNRSKLSYFLFKFRWFSSFAFRFLLKFPPNFCLSNWWSFLQEFLSVIFFDFKPKLKICNFSQFLSRFYILFIKFCLCIECVFDSFGHLKACKMLTEYCQVTDSARIAKWFRVSSCKIFLFKILVKSCLSFFSKSNLFFFWLIMCNLCFQ